MIVRQPSVFAAYVGTGQVINLRRQFEAGYPSLRERASGNEQADRALAAIGPPPWKDDDSYHVVNVWADALDPPSKVSSEVCAAEKLLPTPAYIQAGAEFSNRMLFNAIGKEDMPRFVTRFAVPMVFIQGSDDLLTTTSVVNAYFKSIVAPDKRFIELPATGHLAIFRDPDAFLAQLVIQVRQLTDARR